MKTNDADTQRGSGLFIGSEPLEDVRHRSALGKDDDDAGKDGAIGDKGDDDTTDKGDSDSTDKKGDTGDDSRDSDGKD